MLFFDLVIPSQIHGVFRETIPVDLETAGNTAIGQRAAEHKIRPTAITISYCIRQTLGLKKINLSGAETTKGLAILNSLRDPSIASLKRKLMKVRKRRQAQRYSAKRRVNEIWLIRPVPMSPLDHSLHPPVQGCA
ncbi:hypothetical protein TNCT_139911 [Trichonephila clavata]|uniref:Uncharacterized protein n=1 Tax=Trichonephila clavata TaxID=2740835 RepID=A0A8X6H6P8_TRICU|nr:hypothetical protein TNCT_139911 [Trichonephila clavata]